MNTPCEKESFTFLHLAGESILPHLLRSRALAVEDYSVEPGAWHLRQPKLVKYTG